MQALNYLATRLVRWKEKLDLLLILGLLFIPTYNYIEISLRILQQFTMAGIAEFCPKSCSPLMCDFDLLMLYSLMK